jgi:ATP-binding cassette, subfamily B, bacterial HlyB/CyaB
MTIEHDRVELMDSGLFALTTILRLFGLQAEADEISQRWATSRLGAAEMLSCARQAGLRARWRGVGGDELAGIELPGIVSLRDGNFVILADVRTESVFVFDQASRSMKKMSRAEFDAVWDGRLLLIAPATLGLAPRSGKAPAETPPAPKTQTTQSTVGTDKQGGAPTESDSGLAALVMLLRFHGIGAEREQIRHRLGTPVVGVGEMLRCAKQLGLRARARHSCWERLAQTPLPGVAAMRDGSFLIVGKAGEDLVLVQQPFSPRPEAMTRAEFEARWDGRIVLMARRASLLDLSRRFDITWFLGAIHKYRHLLGEVMVASLFLQVFALISPLFFQVVIDKVLVHRSMSTLDVLVIGLAGIAIFEAVLGALRTFVFAHTTNRIDVELGARLFRHLMALPIAYFQARRVGDSVARVRELENIRQFLTSSALTLVLDLAFTFVFLAVMFYYSPLLTGVVLAAFPLYIGISAGATPLFRRRLDEKFRLGSENQAFLVESVTAVETLKAMAVEPQMQQRWEEQLAGYVAASFRVINLNNAASQAVQLINKLVIAAVLYFGAKLVIEGNLTVGELVAFNMLSGRVSAPVLRLAQIWQDFHQARLSVERLGDILNTQAEPSTSPARAPLPAIRGQIEFEHVTFRYRVDASEVLHDVSFTVAPGQVIGLVGSSGSGKSTLAKLVQRLYVPESGRVLVDGVDLSVVDVAWLRRQIGVVLQENVLFNRSVRENIALVDPTMPMERVIAAAKLAAAHDFILELPEGYDTLVGERGSSLSGGQRQRIAIARALVSDPRVLIFDEASSALDYESERAIQDNMKQIAAGRTVFIIAHRLSTVRRADRIVTLERGRVVEDGSHDELISRNGRYAKFHLLQAGINDIR